jgi:hypothetical protein
LRFSEEELDLIAELTDSVYWGLIQKVLNMGIQDQQTRVLNIDINNGARPLVIAKARAEGAQALASYVGSLKRKKK